MFERKSSQINEYIRRKQSTNMKQKAQHHGQMARRMDVDGKTKAQFAGPLLYIEKQVHHAQGLK